MSSSRDPDTDSVRIHPPQPKPASSALKSADDRIVLADWIPPQQGVVPQIRIGKRWYSTLWALPIGGALLVLLIALAQSLRA